MKKIILCMMMAIGLFGLSGCSSDKHISKDEAKEKALKEVNGDITGYGQDLEDDTPYYEFDIVQEGKRYEVKVHSKTGEIISKELDENYKEENKTEEEVNDNANKVPAPAVSEDDAKKAALEKVGGGTVIKCELSDNDNSYDEGSATTQMYKVTIQYNSKEYDVLVNANSKEIIKVEENVID